MLATLQEREPLYRAAAHHIINTDDKPPEQVTNEILDILKKTYH
jgi:shikimate kinase